MAGPGFAVIDEARGLADLANELGIDRAAIERLHVAYFDSVAATAWADGALTESELADLALVADLLEVPTEHITRAFEPVASPPSEHFELGPGDAVVLTGEMTRPRAEIEADLIAHGLVSASAVSKKVALVVAADPDSLSGKARKARDYGIPVVGEHAIAGLLSGLELTAPKAN
jgi:DNA polymerase III subunit epsilon